MEPATATLYFFSCRLSNVVPVKDPPASMVPVKISRLRLNFPKYPLKKTTERISFVTLNMMMVWRFHWAIIENTIK